MSALTAFMAGTGRDGAGRGVADIRGWDDAMLEAVHDYIQWLFPLPERSAFNPDAPTLTPADIAAIRADPALQDSLRLSLRRMLGFYGFALAEGPPPVVAPAADFAARAATWLHPGNHNMLRITRILRCLHLAGLDAEARALLDALEALYAGRGAASIGPRTIGFWRGAVG